MSGMPAWAVAGPERRAHVARVAALLADWAAQMRVPPDERDRWLRAAWLHDALRDAPAATAFAHGPLAAERARAEGERDPGVLDAVRHHSTGFAGWDDVGRMLYLADYLEPGRPQDRDDRAALAARVAGDRDAVLREVARRRITHALAAGWPLPAETVAFWNHLAAR